MEIRFEKTPVLLQEVVRFKVVANLCVTKAELDLMAVGRPSLAEKIEHLIEFLIEEGRKQD